MVVSKEDKLKDIANDYIKYLLQKVNKDISQMNTISTDISNIYDGKSIGYCRYDWIFENETLSYDDAVATIYLIDKKLNEFLDLKNFVSIYPWSDGEYGLAIWNTKYVLENEDMFYPKMNLYLKH